MAASGGVAARVPVVRRGNRPRHLSPARYARRWIYRRLVGTEGWPLVFHAPETPIRATGVSPHLYVHLPFCRQICPHCPYNKVLFDDGLVGPYAGALLRELSAYLANPRLPRIASLYFGGGTPSLLPELIEQVIGLTRPHLADDCQIGVEVHPADAGHALLARLRAAGVNRISLGIESLQPECLKWLGRRYSPRQALMAVLAARRIGFDCVDVNLLCGLPGQEPGQSAREAAQAIDWGADQVSTYPLFVFRHTALGRRRKKAPRGTHDRHAPITSLREVARTCRVHGLTRTSVWSFTRPGVAPYSTVTQDSYVGIGAGAGSKVDGLFWFNTFSVTEYSAQAAPRPALVMQAPLRLRRFHWVYWQIYKTRLDAAEYVRRFGRDVAQDFPVLMASLRLLGWAQVEGQTIRLTERGAIWAHRVQDLFSIPYIEQMWETCRNTPWPAEVTLE
jgi:oxygen-independent coproporphyrinogen-3 oxidase